MVPGLEFGPDRRDHIFQETSCLKVKVLDINSIFQCYELERPR